MVLLFTNGGCLPQDAAFCAKVHAKLNKVSTASAAAAESLDDNHLRLMLVNGRIIRSELQRSENRNHFIQTKVTKLNHLAVIIITWLPD